MTPQPFSAKGPFVDSSPVTTKWLDEKLAEKTIVMGYGKNCQVTYRWDAKKNQLIEEARSCEGTKMKPGP